jgi:hypothetical protein
VVAVSSLTHSSRTSQKTGAHYGVSHCSAVDFFAAASGVGSAQLPQELVDSTGAACEPPEEEEEGYKSLYTMLRECKCDKPQITCKNRFKGGFKVKKTAKRMSRFIETFLRLFVSH